MKEIWRKVKRFPAYSISSLGRVRRDALTYSGFGSVRKSSGVLKLLALPLGHLRVTLSMNNTPSTQLVHRLVAEAFLGPRPKGKDCVCHRDDDPSNNRPTNLFWGTRRDNSDDKIRKGRQAKGSMIGTSKLTEAKVTEIRMRLRRGDKQYEVAADYGVTKSNVSMIATRVTWQHVP